MRFLVFILVVTLIAQSAFAAPDPKGEPEADAKADPKADPFCFGWGREGGWEGGWGPFFWGR